MTVVLVGAAAAREKPCGFLFVTPAARITFNFIQHVVTQLLHFWILPYVCQGMSFAIAHGMIHFSMTAWIDFACGIGVQVYPWIDAEYAALHQQEFFSISEVIRGNLYRFRRPISVVMELCALSWIADPRARRDDPSDCYGIS